MKYLKYFKTEAEYVSYKNGSDYVTPNVSYTVDTTNVFYGSKTLEPKLASAGDIAYWDGSKVKTVSQEKWDVSLGTPVGVVVVPTGFAPDGKARMIALSGQTSVAWGGYGTDTSLTNYNRVPTTDNAGATTTGSASSAYLPSDKFTGTVSYVDPGTQYSGTSRTMIPSPYLTVDGKNEPNPAYYAEISGYNNALSDFNGLENTQTLVGLGTGYTAANACWTYKDAANSTTQWYLPAMGELGYMMPRFNEIQAGLAAVGAVQLASSFSYWSISEYSSNTAYYVSTNDGSVDDRYKHNSCYVRPFAIID